MPTGSYTASASGIVARQAVTMADMADGDALNATNLNTAPNRTADVVAWLMANASVVDSATALTYSTGFAAGTGTGIHGAKAVKIGGRTFLSGRIVNSTGSPISPGFSVASGIPAGSRFSGGVSSGPFLCLPIIIVDSVGGTFIKSILRTDYLGGISLLDAVPGGGFFDLDGLWFFNTAP
jgi:hypothetical protein